MIVNSRSNKRRSILLFVLAVLLVTVSSSSAFAELTANTQVKARDRNIIRIVTDLLDKQHLLRRNLDDEISRRTFQTFVKQLDPMKVYFYQSDIDEFSQNRETLDDQARNGSITFAYTVFNRFRKRLDERVAIIPELLPMDRDFSVIEELVTDLDVAAHPMTASYAQERW